MTELDDCGGQAHQHRNMAIERLGYLLEELRNEDAFDQTEWIASGLLAREGDRGARDGHFVNEYAIGIA